MVGTKVTMYEACQNGELEDPIYCVICHVVDGIAYAAPELDTPIEQCVKLSVVVPKATTFGVME